MSIITTPARAQTTTILAYGDSLVAGKGLPEALAFPARLEARLLENGHDVKVVNAGVSGETTSGGLTRLEWVLGLHEPDAVVLVLGGNDMMRATNHGVTRGNLAKMLDVLTRRNIPVLLAGMKSMHNINPFNDSFQDIYEDLAEEYADRGVILFPFFLEDVAMVRKYNQPDGIHPNAAGVEVIVDNIYPYVVKLLQEVRGG